MKIRKVCLAVGVFFVGAVLCEEAGLVRAQTTVVFDCPEDECHVLPYFRGEGGFIGAIQPGRDTVEYFVSCGNSNVGLSVEPDARGLVAELLNVNNGLACDRDDGAVQIRGLQDGGWYWITKEENTAISFLMPKGILSNRKTTLANPGWNGLTFTLSKDGAVSFLEEVATGRVGILPRVLPAADEAPPRCGQYKEGEGDDETTKQRVDDCLMDAVYSVRLTSGPGTGTPVTGGLIYRPGTGETVLTLGLYGIGHLDVAGDLGAGFDESLTAGYTVTARVQGAAGLPTSIGTERALGLTANLSGTPPTLTVHNSADSDGLCTEDDQYALAVEIKATAAAASPGVNEVLPPVPGESLAGDFRPTTTLNVRCPGTGTAQGRELVPAGPLPDRAEDEGP